MTTMQRTPIERESTTEANKAVARQVIERIFVNQEDRAIDELVAEDFVPHTFRPMPRGREGLREGMKRAGAGVSEPRFEIEDLIAEGDRVVARLRTSARHTGPFMGVEPTGNRYTNEEIHIFRIRDGRLAEHWHAFDTLGLMRQLKGEDAAGSDGPRQSSQASVAR
jgi:predicted ester cyclase